jgi:subtilisin family serine protease
MARSRFAARVVIGVLALAFGVAGQAVAQDARYIVKFRAGRGGPGEAAVRAAGGDVVVVLGPQDAVAARIPAAALNGLSRNPNVEYIEEDAVREPYAVSDVLAAGSETLPYGVQLVQADLVSTSAADSRKICIIDSGYSQQQEDLKDAITGEVTFTGTGVDSGSGTWDKDSCGHGTHVAGTISAIAGNGVGVVGVDPGVRLHIVKVFGNDVLDGGSCNWTYSSNLIAALNACKAAGANVVSMSLGGTFKNKTEETAFASANSAGILSIAAAGNGGNTRTSYPAGYASVMSVAALDANEALGSFSQRNPDVEIAAPGVSVLSTVPWHDVDTLTADAITWTGGRIDGAARTTGTIGALVDGGQCTAAGSWAGRVVVCQRGSNSFAAKVTNVQNGGGVAAVIYNNIASDATCGVFTGTLADPPQTNIPATTLSCQDGAAALGHVNSNGDVVSKLSVPDSDYERWDGTSMATPHVSGVAALVWSCNPGLTNQQVRNALTSSAKDEGAAGRDTSFGFGLVQAKAAVLSLGMDNINCSVK